MLKAPAPMIEVPGRKVVEIEWDTEQDTATITWSDGTVQSVLILELIFGPQGTWAKLTPVDDPTYVICVTQSATMPSETYIVHEVPEIPEQPMIITEPEVASEITEEQLQEQQPSQEQQPIL